MIHYSSLFNPLFARVFRGIDKGVTLMPAMVLGIAWFALIKALIFAAYYYLQFAT